MFNMIFDNYQNQLNNPNSNEDFLEYESIILTIDIINDMLVYREIDLEEALLKNYIPKRYDEIFYNNINNKNIFEFSNRNFNKLLFWLIIQNHCRKKLITILDLKF